MRYILLFAALVLRCFTTSAQERKEVEYGEPVDALLVHLAIPEKNAEGPWVFDLTIKNTDTKKNRSNFFMDRPCGWSYELESKKVRRKDLHWRIVDAGSTWKYKSAVRAAGRIPDRADRAANTGRDV